MRLAGARAAPSGFGEAFPALFAPAYRAAYRVLGDRGDAEVVAQEALARAVVRWEQLAFSPERWTVRVVVNLAIDRRRRRRRRRPLPDPWTRYSDADAALAGRLDLARALRRLPRRQRQGAVLRYLADGSEQDVTRELGCSVGTVKSNGSAVPSLEQASIGPASATGRRETSGSSVPPKGGSSRRG